MCDSIVHEGFEEFRFGCSTFVVSIGESFLDIVASLFLVDFMQWPILSIVEKFFEAIPIRVYAKERGQCFCISKL
jgi:hypothetical protein